MQAERQILFYSLLQLVSTYLWPNIHISHEAEHLLPAEDLFSISHTSLPNPPWPGLVLSPHGISGCRRCQGILCPSPSATFMGRCLDTCVVQRPLQAGWVRCIQRSCLHPSPPRAGMVGPGGGSWSCLGLKEALSCVNLPEEALTGVQCQMQAPLRV